MKYLSIDIETTGLRRDRDQILEFAAVLEDTCSQEPTDGLPKYTARLYYEEVIGQPYALHLNAEIILSMNSRPNCYHWVHPSTLASGLRDFVDAYKGWDRKDKITVAGKNAALFDLQFLNHLPNWDRWMGYRIHHRVIDPAMYYFHAESDEVLPDTKTCIHRSGIAWSDGRLHSAYEDAMLVIELMRRGPTYLKTRADMRAIDARSVLSTGPAV